MTDRPQMPELVEQWLDLKAQHEVRSKEVDDHQKDLDTTVIEAERLLAAPLGVCQPWELTEVRIKLRWAVHWRDDALANLRLVEWKQDLLDNTDKVLELHERLG